MKGQAKRFLSHKGKAYDVEIRQKKQDGDDSIGFLQLWRYSTLAERLTTLLGVLLSWWCAVGLVAAVVSYGELTSLFVQRHRAVETTPHAHILRIFGGGQILPEGNRSLHMDALVQDSIAYGLASIAIIVIQLTAAAAAVTLANWAAERMVSRLRLRLLESVISQEVAFFDTNTNMNFASSLTEDMDKLKAGVGEHVVMTSYLLGTVVAGAGISLAYGWQLTLVGLTVVPLALIVAAVVAQNQTKCSAREVSAYSAAARIVEGALAAIRTVRAYAGEEFEVQSYVSALKPAALEAKRRGLWAGAGAGLGWLLTYSLNAVVFAYGTILCVQDMDLPAEEQQYHPGIMVTVLFCTFMAAQNIAMCNPHLEIFSSARGAAKSVYQLLERKSKINALDEGGVKPDAFKGDIVFDNLYFNYPSRPDAKVLRGLSLRVQAGQTVAFVGGSGCGKSTVLQLLQRLYEPDSGSITVDGHRLNDLNLHHYRTSIGVVGQEPVLFSGTIRENITLGLQGVAEEELIAAANIAHAHQFISKLVHGYDTVLGDNGTQLSGGQKQRIAIARAVLRRPAILLLDEPTSALDPAAERQVQAALDAASRGRTTLVVSHRLSTIVNADRIVYMEQGAVLEQGTHGELLEKQGMYQKLVQEDLTSKSIATTLQESKDEDNDVFASKEADHFRRATSKQLTLSLRGSKRIRGSNRIPSVSSAHVPNAAALDLLNYAEPQEEEAEDQMKQPGASTLELLKLNKPEWPLLLGGGTASFVVGATMPVFALLFSKLYGMFAWSDPAAILKQSELYAGLFAAVAALCGLVTFLQAWLFNRAGAKLTDRLRELTFRNYLKQEQAWFDEPENSVGALCARLATDCAAVQGATGTRLGTVLQGVSTMVLGVGLAMTYSWKMTLVSLLSVPCVIGGIYLEGRVTRLAETRERKALEEAARRATEAVLNVRTVQSLGVERALLERYMSALRERADGVRMVRGAVYGLCLCAPTLGYAISLVYGGYLIAREDLNYEYAILVSEALIYGAWMLAEALSFAPNFAAARRSGARILTALGREPKIVTDPKAKQIPDWSATGDVTFSNVHFSYPSRPSAPILRGVTLHEAAGRTVALVGPSGCGKSTLLQLLLRSYDPEQGTVELDGQDTKQLPLSQLREQLGLVQQEPALFERSIRENISYGALAQDPPFDELVRAAQQANIHDFIVSLPQGYDTVLGSGGASLSGGQKQRIAIARALVRNPKVLLLDEATSALDANSEKTVQAALEAASKERTTIIIAHRLATVRHAYSIAVINKGVVVERGSHDELVRRKGVYWDLLQQQAGDTGL